jgi:alpha-methylacyl-CoA racemase
LHGVKSRVDPRQTAKSFYAQAGVIGQCGQTALSGRMTGFGQAGPLAHAAGHDLNYIALTGALDAIGPAGGAPVPPLNLVGDYGGGGMLRSSCGARGALHACVLD